MPTFDTRLRLLSWKFREYRSRRIYAKTTKKEQIGRPVRAVGLRYSLFWRALFSLSSSRTKYSPAYNTAVGYSTTSPGTASKTEGKGKKGVGKYVARMMMPSVVHCRMRSRAHVATFFFFFISLCPENGILRAVGMQT